jgi:hypothetical protein
MAVRKKKGSNGSEAPKLRRLGCPIDAGVHGRISAYAAWRGESLGQVVNRCLEAELSRVKFTVYCGTPDRPPAGQAPPSPAPTGGPSEGPEGPSEAPRLRVG